MNKKTEEDMDKIIKLETEIALSKLKIMKIKEKCPHHNYVVEHVETFKFESHPMRVCLICNKHMGDPNLEEKVQLLESWYDDIDIKPPDDTDELWISRLDGFNLPMRAFRRKDYKLESKDEN